jgi:hypothetical protein
MIRLAHSPRAWGGVGAVGVLFCACHTPEWINLRIASPYRRPSYGVNVSVTIGAPGPGLEEYADALTTDLVADLHDVGLDATVDMDSPTSAQLRLHVVEWVPGNETARIFIGHGAGAGHVAIVVDLKEPGGRTLVHGRIQGHFAGGIYGGSPHDAVRAEANSIADLLNTGE